MKIFTPKRRLGRNERNFANKVGNKPAVLVLTVSGLACAAPYFCSSLLLNSENVKNYYKSTGPKLKSNQLHVNSNVRHGATSPFYILQLGFNQNLGERLYSDIFTLHFY